MIRFRHGKLRLELVNVLLLLDALLLQLIVALRLGFQQTQNVGFSLLLGHNFRIVIAQIRRQSIRCALLVSFTQIQLFK